MGPELSTWAWGFLRHRPSSGSPRPIYDTSRGRAFQERISNSRWRIQPIVRQTYKRHRQKIGNRTRTDDLASHRIARWDSNQFLPFTKIEIDRLIELLKEDEALGLPSLVNINGFNRHGRWPWPKSLPPEPTRRVWPLFCHLSILSHSADICGPL